MILELLFSAQMGFAHELLKSDPPKEIQQNETYTFQPAAGHHFNVKAPQSCGSQKAQSVDPREVKCAFNTKGTQKVNFKVCDDALTYCKDATATIEVVAGKAKAAAQNEKPTLHYQPKFEMKETHGFIMNDPQKAIATAKSKKQKILIDFFGVWCPPCNMLDELVFPKKEFQSLTKNIVRLKLNADSDVSWELKDKYKVRGIPTLVIVDSDLNEYGRIIGYSSAGKISEWLKKSSRKDAPTMQSLEAKWKETKKLSSEDRELLGSWAFENKQYALAMDVLNDQKDAASKILYYSAQLQQAKADKKDDTVKTAILKQLIDVQGDSPEYLSSLSELQELNKTAAQPYIEKLESKAALADNQKALDEAGWAAGDVYSAIADIYETAGNEPMAKKYFLLGADAFGKMAEKSVLKTSRGPNLERAYCLYKAGETEKAEQLYKSMISSYPEEYTFHYYYARTLFELKKYDAALAELNLAEKYSYGDNWLKTMNLKAKTLRALNKNAEAKSLIEDTLKKAVVPENMENATSREYKKLQALLNDVVKK